jgi:hypothetical protein
MKYRFNFFRVCILYCFFSTDIICGAVHASCISRNTFKALSIHVNHKTFQESKTLFFLRFIDRPFITTCIWRIHGSKPYIVRWSLVYNTSLECKFKRKNAKMSRQCKFKRKNAKMPRQCNLGHVQHSTGHRHINM